jgi:hypothetical protein
MGLSAISEMQNASCVLLTDLEACEGITLTAETAEVAE